MALYNWPMLPYAGAPTDAVNEIQSVTITADVLPTGGTLTLTYDGQTTAAIAYNASAAAVESALQALSNIEAGDVQCAGGALPSAVTVTFKRNLGGKNVSAMTASGAGLTGGTNVVITIATPTPGVQGTYRGAQAGALLCDTTNGILYYNTGDPYTPIWTEIEP